MRVLEARDRVGGRTLSQPLGADVIDLGAQWIGPTQDRVAKLTRDLGVETFPQLHEGKKLLDRDGTVTPYSGLIPKLPIVHLLEAALGIARLELLARKVPTDHPDRARNAARWDAMTAEDWLSRSIRTRGAKTVLRIATEMIFGAEPRDLSFLISSSICARAAGSSGSPRSRAARSKTASSAARSSSRSASASASTAGSK